MVSSKVSSALPVQLAEKQAPVQYIRYTPSQQGTAFNSGAKQRIIQMVEVQKDPMEPPRFKFVFSDVFLLTVDIEYLFCVLESIRNFLEVHPVHLLPSFILPPAKLP